jgi:hypothetical protein
VRIAINESGLFDFLVQYYFTLPSQDRKQAACLEVKRGLDIAGFTNVRESIPLAPSPTSFLFLALAMQS